MTKTWEAVREETCRLYSEGRSLEYIRKHLLRERHFAASTRAFRLKLKAWKVKRSESACSSCGSLPHDEKTRCDSGVFLAPPPNVSESSTDELADNAGLAERKSLGCVYEDLLQAHKSADQALQGTILRTCIFSEARTSILHYAAKEPQREGRHAVIAKILVHLQRLGHSLDIRDELGQTALEIAIKTDQSVLVGMLLERGASVEQLNAQGQQPLHIALDTEAFASINSHLLENGADPNLSLLKSQKAIKPLTFAIDRLAQESARAPNTFDGSCLKWFKTISKLLEHGAMPKTEDLKSVICLFNKYWHLSSASEELLECVKPILQVYFRSGLDPAQAVSASERDSLAHSAFHHAQNNSLATFTIEEADLQKHGCGLVRYILTTSECPKCPYPTPNLDEALRMLLEEMTSLNIPLDFDPLVECLTRTPGEHNVKFVTTIQELHPVHRRGHRTFERRDDFVKAVAALPRDNRFRVAEILLRRDSSVEHYDGIADVMRSVETSLPTVCASKPEIIEASACGFLGFCDCSKSTKQDFIHCVIHVATKEAIERLDGTTVKEQLGRLVALREWYQLPGVEIPQRLLAAALGIKIDGTRSFVPGGVHDSKGWCYVGLEANV